MGMKDTSLILFEDFCRVLLGMSVAEDAFNIQDEIFFSQEYQWPPISHRSAASPACITPRHPPSPACYAAGPPLLTFYKTAGQSNVKKAWCSVARLSRDNCSCIYKRPVIGKPSRSGRVSKNASRNVYTSQTAIVPLNDGGTIEATSITSTAE